MAESSGSMATKKPTKKKTPTAKAVKPAARAKSAEPKAATRPKPAKVVKPSKPAARSKPETRIEPKPVAATKAVAVEKPAPAPKAPRKTESRRVAVAQYGPEDLRPASRESAAAGVAVEGTPAKPQKPAVDAEWMATIREAMVQQRHELLSVVSSTQAQMAEKAGDLPDVSDRASEGFEDELAVGLIAIEAAKLDDIEAAIKRIDDGSYGLCIDCGKAIPRKRLEVLPFARRCLACAGESERRVREMEEIEDEDDND